MAERHLGIDEKTVRKWRSGEKPVPLAALLVLPGTLADVLHDRIRQSRARVPLLRLIVTALRAAVAQLEAIDVPEGERWELLREVVDVQRRLGEVVCRLTPGAGGR